MLCSDPCRGSVLGPSPAEHWLRAGIIDDIYGADFVDGSTDGNVQDQNGHGTFVAGVVGAVGNNGIGVTGVNQVLLWQSGILPTSSRMIVDSGMIRAAGGSGSGGTAVIEV